MKRIRLYAVLTVLVIMLMMLALSFMICRYAMNTENHVRYTGIMNVAAEKIAKTINGMEMNAMNVFDEVEKNMFSPEDVIAALYSKADLNPNVNGYFAAFEPDHFPQKGRWFEPYVHKSDKGNKYVMSQVGSARHDYTKSDWYVRAKDVGVSFWSDPYYYYDGTSISGHYCTFVEPIFDAEKNLLCVCGADMTLEWLAKELKQIDMASKQNDKTSSFLMDQKRDFYTVVLNSDGSCLASPEGKSLSLKYEQALEDLKERRSGMLETSVNGEAVTVYYCPIQNIDWVVAVVVPTKHIQQPVILAGLILLALVMLGMIVVLMVKTNRFIIPTVTVTMLAMMIVTILVCHSVMKAQTKIRYTGVMHVASERINRSLSGLEMNAKNVFDELQKNMESPEAVIKALQSKTNLNPDVKGYFAAFEPDFFPQRGKWFQPYIHKSEDNSQYVVTQLDSMAYDYTKSEMYKRAKAEGKSFWSDPYKYDNDSHLSGNYCSYLTPIYDADGKLVCVCGADLTFEWLEKELRQTDHKAKLDDLMKRFLWNDEPDFHTVVTDHNGSCIASAGTTEAPIKQDEVNLYSGPISHTNWTVAVVVPQHDHLKLLLGIGLIQLAVVVVGTVVVWIILRSTRDDED